MIHRRLLAILLRRRSLALGFPGNSAIQFGIALCLILQAYWLSQLIARAFLDGQNLAALQSLFAGLAGLTILRGLLAWLKEVSADAYTARLKIHLRDDLQEHLVRLGPLALGGEQTGELINTLGEGVEALDPYFRDYLPQLTAALLTPAAMLVFIFPRDWISGLVLLVTAPLIPFFMILIGNAADAAARRQWHTTSRMSAFFLDMVQGLTTLKMLGRSTDVESKIAAVSERHRRATMSVLRVAFLSALTLELLATISTAIVAVGIGLRLLAGRLVFADALCVLFLAPDFYAPLRLLGARFHAAVSGTAAAERIFALLDRGVPDAQPGGRSSGGESSASGIPPYAVNEITFEHVSAAYASGAEPALRDLSLSLKQGRLTALVGASGAGKTTLAALLLGFMDPSQGTIRLNGVPLAEVDLADWRRRIAWVPQRPHIFHDSVLENIRLAHPQATVEEVVAAARRAGAHAFIERLPQGYATLVGERGARLSGGQAQRLALARAYLKPQTDLLILDEPATHLDALLAEETSAAAQSLAETKAALVIAHRLETVRRAHEVLVLQAGEIVQRGEERALAQIPGAYRDLLHRRLPAACEETQAARFSTPAAEDTTEPFEEDVLETAEPRLKNGDLALSLLGSLACGFATIAAGIGLLATSAYVISAAALRPSIADISVAIVGVRFFGLARGLFRYLERLVSHDATFRILTRLRVRLYGIIEPLAPARLSAYHSGDLLARLVTDIQSLENLYLRAVYPPLVALSGGVLAVLIMGHFASSFAFITAAALLLGGIGLPALAWLFSRRAGARAVQERAALNTAGVDLIQGLADLLAAGGTQRTLARCRRHGLALAHAQTHLAWVNGAQNGLSVLLLGSATLALLFAGVLRVQTGALDGVFLAVIVMILWGAYEAVQPLPLAAQYLESNRAVLGRLRELQRAEPEVTDPPGERTSGVRRVSYAPGGLEFERVTFAYPGTEEDVLRDVSFELPEGKWMAIVGASGAGKSTILALLLRFWEYRSGKILLGGTDVRSLAQAEARRQMAVAAQRTDLFQGSVRANIALSKPGAGMEEVVEAARDACLHDFITRLPQGYETWIGEDGSRLSGGERRRLSLARAFLPQAPLLLLDEPAAGLDAGSERNVMEGIFRRAQGRSLLLITHRLTGLERVHEILVMQAGRIVERGTQAQLERANGLFARMLHCQRNTFV